MNQRVLSVIIGRGPDPSTIRQSVAAKYPNSIVQTLSVEAATNRFYIEMIAAQTLSANETPSLLARKPEVDLLLRFAGTTQISRAIRQMGARKGKEFILVIAGPSRELANLSGEDLGGRELGVGSLSQKELDRIETAALLNASTA